MSGQHTPGPWHHSHEEMFGRDGKGSRHHIFELRDQVVLPAPGQAGPVAIAAGEANARLIASAPELLEALSVARTLSRGYVALAKIHDTETSNAEAAVALIEDAIAKATGAA